MESVPEFSSSFSSAESQSFLTQPSASEDSFHTPLGVKSRVTIDSKVSLIDEADTEQDSTSAEDEEVAQPSDSTSFGQKCCDTWKSQMMQRVVTISAAVASALAISKLSSLN